MSGLTINKLASRTYGSLWVLVGVILLLTSCALFFLSFFGFSSFGPSAVEAVTKGVAAAGVDQPTFEKYLGVFGLFLLVISAIPTTIGVLAFKRYLAAMIVGNVLWMSLVALVIVADMSLPDAGPLKLSEHVFGFTSIAVLVLLTIAAIYGRPRPVSGLAA